MGDLPVGKYSTARKDEDIELHCCSEKDTNTRLSI
jgi:hypothetical protein